MSGTRVRSVVKFLRGLAYPALVAALAPINRIMAGVCRRRVSPGSVLHVSYAGHVPYQTVEILRANGVDAAYLAVGTSPVWDRSDYRTVGSRWPPVLVAREFRLVWGVIARYEIVHLHFMVTATRSGWELPLLKRMGRRIVVHYRGCEIRDRERNRRLHPDLNICDECDYNPRPCEENYNVRRRALAARYGDAFLVTTPDLKEFAPAALHMPFFVPPALVLRRPADAPRAGRIKIVHATNHAGIEGTRTIVAAVEALKGKGFPIDLVVLQGVPQERVLEELADATLAIGKLKMGYYANAQIESMATGVPTVTWIRPEFRTDALDSSGFIYATPETLETVLAHYLTHPDALARKRAAARDSILRLHDNREIAARYRTVYGRVLGHD